MAISIQYRAKSSRAWPAAMKASASAAVIDRARRLVLVPLGPWADLAPDTDQLRVPGRNERPAWRASNAMADEKGKPATGRPGHTADDIRSPTCFLPPSLLKETRVKTADLIDHVASEADVEKSAAKKAVDAVFAGIVAAAKRGEEVNLAGFGKFKVKDSPPRQGRNPATGETIEIAASRKLGFNPAKQVKDALAD